MSQIKVFDGHDLIAIQGKVNQYLRENNLTVTQINHWYSADKNRHFLTVVISV